MIVCCPTDKVAGHCDDFAGHDVNRTLEHPPLVIAHCNMLPYGDINCINSGSGPQKINIVPSSSSAADEKKYLQSLVGNKPPVCWLKLSSFLVPSGE